MSSSTNSVPTIENWCLQQGHSDEIIKKLRDDMGFTTVNDLYILNEKDLNEVGDELKLTFAKKSMFLKTVKDSRAHMVCYIMFFCKLLQRFSLSPFIIPSYVCFEH